MRVLKLWVIVDDKNIYDLSEGKPLLIAPEKLPMKIVAQNGYHSSKPFYINNNSGKPLYLKIGCNADNEQFWGSLILSLFFFILFFITSFGFVLFIANIPLVFLVYKFFFKHKEFITITPLKIVYEKEKK